jgi:hypothetical protein
VEIGLSETVPDSRYGFWQPYDCVWLLKTANEFRMVFRNRSRLAVRFLTTLHVRTVAETRLYIFTQFLPTVSKNMYGRQKSFTYFLTVAENRLSILIRFMAAIWACTAVENHLYMWKTVWACVVVKYRVYILETVYTLVSTPITTSNTSREQRPCQLTCACMPAR